MKHGSALQNELVEELFKLYFCEERHIGDVDVLLEAMKRTLGGGGGGFGEKEKIILDQAKELLLDSQAFLAEVKEELLMGKKRVVSGVPHFVVDKKLQFSGALDTDLMLEALEEVLSRKSM